MKLLWNEKTAAEATGGEARGHWHASRVEIDSRKVQLGDVFVAIKGERVDGHHYVADAFARGAVAAIVSHVPGNLPQNCSLVIVKDTLDALVAMAKFSRARSHAKIIGVTGSVGKTSAKEMLKLALAAHGKTYASSGNFNNHIGMPLNLANLPVDAAFGVFELGMNHAGEIKYLTEILRPHVAAITNIEAVHLEFFKDVQGIADAKAEIFEGVEKGGIALLPADSPFCDYLRDKARGLSVLTFGMKEGADIGIASYMPTPRGADMVADIGGRALAFSIAATGKHFAQTSALTLGVAKALELSLSKTATAMAAFAESDGRGKLIATGTSWLIDDSYNASPASMKAAIAKADEVWQQLGGKGRKIAALGDMLELGRDAPQLHAALSEALVAHGFHLVFTAGGLMRHLSLALPQEIRAPHMPDAKSLAPLIQKTIAPGDVLLVKGSHGSKMYELAAMLQSEKKQAV